MSESASDFDEAIRLAYQLKRRIKAELGLTASVGVGCNKFLAKIASDLRKPDGVYAVRPDRIKAFLDPLPIGKLWGVGPKTEIRLKRLGIATVGQLQEEKGRRILEKLGRHGAYLLELAQGIDNRPLVTYRRPKSIGHEHTFSSDTRDRELLLETLRHLAKRTALRLQKHELAGKTVCVKLRYEDFTTFTRQDRSRIPIQSADEIFELARLLFLDNWDDGRQIRLIGVTVSSLEEESAETGLPLFPRPDPGDLSF